MAIFRKIHTQFWSDPFIQSLSPEKKYFFLYLLTNEKTRQCGIYEISKRHISYDTGYTIDTVSILLEYFIQEDKIMFSEDTNEIAIKNWNKFNKSGSPQVQTLINKEITQVKNKTLIQYIYSIDIVPILNTQEEEEEEEEKDKKNKKKKEMENVEFPTMTKIDFLEFRKKLLEDDIFTSPLMMGRGIKNKEELENWVIRYDTHISGEGKINKDYSEYRKHFKNWILKQDTFNTSASKPEKKMVL